MKKNSKTIKTYAPRVIFLSLILCCLATIPASAKSSTLDSNTLNIFSQNNILFYSPCSNAAGSSVDVCGATLPSSTIEYLEQNNIKAKAEANMERYKYAEQETGIPWAAIAALHWREAGMASDASISNGQKLTADGSCYTNVDGISICGDAKQDAVEAAKHLISNAKGIYDVELTANSPLEDWANAFLAYNRGAMYKVAGATYDESPYVMNGFDENHLNMIWIHADSWYGSKQYNSVEGKRDGDPIGALALFAYLCGNNSATVNSSSSTSSADGSDITIIGDSITKGAKAKIQEKLPKADIYAQGCKTISVDLSTSCDGPNNKSGKTLVNEVKLRKKVIFALGANETSASEQTLQSIIDKIGTDKTIFLVTVYENGKYASGLNAIYEKLANTNNNVKIIRWGEAVQDDPSLVSDGTHPTTNGAEKLASLFAEDSGGCTSAEFTYYAQSDSRWGSEPFDNCGTIAGCGCGPSSFAMMATMLLGREITPSETTKLACAAGDCTADGSAHTITKHLADHYGLEYQPVNVSSSQEAISKISSLLKDGWMIHTSNGCHYIGIRGITSTGKWLVADSSNQNYSESEHTPEDWMNGGWGSCGAAMNIYNIHAIRANGNSACASDKCANKNAGGLEEGGFESAETADKAVMQPYRDLDKEPTSTLTGQYGLYYLDVASRNHYLENCVSFSVYFVNKYTSIRDNGNPITGYSDGGGLAKAIYDKLGSDYPKLTLSSTPTVYSLASCGSSSYSPGTYSHTFIVLGINKTNNTMIIGEAGYKSGWDFIGAKEKTLDNAKYAGSTCSYLDMSAYLTGGL